LNAGVEELDRERVISNRAALSDQLVEMLSCHDALPIGIDIDAVTISCRGTVNGDAEPYLLSVHGWTENEMQVAGMEPIDDAAAFLVEHGIFLADRPISCQRPFIAP
jgi:hypothetical protein